MGHCYHKICSFTWNLLDIDSYLDTETGGFAEELSLSKMEDSDDDFEPAHNSTKLDERDMEDFAGHLPALEESQDHLPALEESQDHLPALEESQDHLPALEESQDHLPALEESQDHLPALKESQDHHPALKESQDHLPALKESQDHLPALKESQDHLPALKESQDHLPALKESQDQVPVYPNKKRKSEQVKPSRLHSTDSGKKRKRDQESKTASAPTATYPPQPLKIGQLVAVAFKEGLYVGTVESVLGKRRAKVDFLSYRGDGLYIQPSRPSIEEIDQRCVINIIFETKKINGKIQIRDHNSIYKHYQNYVKSYGL